MIDQKHYGGKDYVPVSIRLAFEEKAYLQEQAGVQSLSGYIRSELLKNVKPRRKQRRKKRKPSKSDKQMSRLFGIFMNSSIAGNINQMAKQANSGSLNHADPEIKARLFEAFDHIVDMRRALFKELGIDHGEK